MRHFSRRLLTVAGILVLAVTVLATMAFAGTIDKPAPQMQVGNTGEVWMPPVQGDQIIPEAVVDLTPKMLVGNTGETLSYVFQGHDITPPEDRGALNILYAPTEADNATFRSNLAACTGATVDYYDPRAATPDVALLSGYDMVFTWVNYAYLDNVAMGNNLAAYVDGGGKVVLGQWCLPTAGNYLSGAIMGSAYCPVTGSSYQSGSYNLDGTDCVHDGVTVYSSDYFDVATLVSGALSDGTFSNPANSLAVAWRADRKVYYSPGNTGVTYGTGDWATVTCKMFLCTDGGGKGPILYAPSEADNPTFRADIAACTGVAVDYFDPRVATPDVAMLSGYDMVIVWGNYAFADAVAYGDNLADYVDGGGKVVLGQWCYHTTQVNWLEGRIMTAAYCPITASAYQSGSYNMDGTECEHDGVGAYASDYFDACTAISGAVSDGTFNNPANSLALAWRADQMVYYSPGNTGVTYGTGAWADQVCNIYTCGGSGPMTTPVIITGPGAAMANPPRVRTWDPDDPSAFVNEWPAYGVDQFGVNVACGDLDNDGYDSVITGAGPGAVFGPHVRGFAIDGTPVSGVSYLAYGTNKYGVNVACGDVDGDGYDEIITGAGPGAVFGPHVRGWDVDGGTPTSIGAISYFAYGTPKWGTNVACGDIDGDGYDEIVTGAGPGSVYGPHVRGWNYDDNAIASIGGVSFLAYGTNQFGVNVGCGDIDGDGIDEIITGPGPGVVFGPHVRAWNYDGSGTATSISGVSFFANDGCLYGAFIAAVDLDGDGYDEILTMPGPDPTQEAVARAWNVDGGTAALIGTIDFDAYDDLGLMYGGKIAGGNF
jgi:hypothetical protein